MIRGSIAFDPPDRALRADAFTGKWHDPIYRRQYYSAWRNKNREALRAYNREYQRAYRARKR